MIIFGTNTFGGTDEVDDLFKVKTQFFHVWFVPLIPISSYLVVDESMGSFNGIRIPFSIKSMLIAWSRTALFFSSIFAMIGVAINAGNIASAAFCVLAAIICIAMLIASYAVRAITHASYERAIQLIHSAGIAPQLTPVVNQVFGKTGGFDMQYAQQQVVNTIGGGSAAGPGQAVPGQPVYPQAGQQTPHAQPVAPPYSQPAAPTYSQPAAPTYSQPAAPPYGKPDMHGDMNAPAAGGVRWGTVIGISMAGVFGLLLCGGVFAVAIGWMANGVAEQGELAENRNRRNQPEFVELPPPGQIPPEFRPPIPPPVDGGQLMDGRRRDRDRDSSSSPEMSIDEAVELALSNDEMERSRGFSFLRRSENVVASRRSDVSEALLTVPRGKDTVSYQSLRALELWAVPSNVPALIDVADMCKRIEDSTRMGKVVEILSGFNDVSVAEGLVFALDDYRAKEKLAELGPGCADHVLPYLNDRDYSTRENARELVIETWKLDMSRVFEQCAADASDGGTEVASLAGNLLAEIEANESYREQFAAVLELVVVNGDEDAAEEAIEQLAETGRVPESPDAVITAMGMFPDSRSILNAGVTTLGELRAESGIGVIVAALDSDADRSRIEKALIAIGTPEAARAIVPYFNSSDYGRKDTARSVIESLGRPEMVLSQISDDLRSDDPGRIRTACDWLKDQQPDPALKNDVSESLAVAIRTTVDAEDFIAARTCLEACKTWGTGACSEVIVSQLQHENSLITSSAFDALANMKVSSTYPAIASGMFGSGATMIHSQRALETIGIGAEEAVINLLDEADDRAMPRVIRLLGEIGGTASIRALRSFKRSDNVVIKATAERAIESIESRPREEVPTASPHGPMVRTWKNAAGDEEIVGKLLDFRDGNAVLEINGEVFDTPLSLLSDDDQAYIKDEMDRRRAAESSGD
ncbi:MAG: hypothetical protein AAF456_21055 [Planctomycetota bacterium]